MVDTPDQTASARKAIVLIVEDEWLVAIDLAEEVTGDGYEVLGPAHTVSEALDLIKDADVDAALLDVNLRNETSYPVAEALAERGVPFSFLSGYAENQLEAGFQDLRAAGQARAACGAARAARGDAERGRRRLTVPRGRDQPGSCWRVTSTVTPRWVSDAPTPAKVPEIGEAWAGVRVVATRISAAPPMIRFVGSNSIQPSAGT